MSGFKGKSKGRSSAAASALRSNQKRGSAAFSTRSNSVSASDDHHHASAAAVAPIASLLPDKTDAELTYADMISALNATLAESSRNISETLPATKSLLSLQRDLDTMLKLNAKNLEECDTSLSKIKRLGSALERENAKRAKLSNNTSSSTQPESNGTSKTPPPEREQTATTEEPEVKIKTETDANYMPMSTDNIGLEDDANDPEKKPTPEYEKNPKSEFVESQELPIAILGLFDENAVEDGLPVNGEEYLKKKYAVASYPKNDLKDQLPGEIPDMDFTKAKPPNQVQFSTFSTYIEPYFRQFTEEDLAFLQQKFITAPTAPTAGNASAAAADHNQAKKALLSPYIIPPLGQLYTTTWAAEDGPNPGYNLSPPPLPSKEEVVAKGTSDSIIDDALETESISCGPLASRLLAALMSETAFDEEIKKEEEEDEVKKVKIEDKEGEEETTTSTATKPEEEEKESGVESAASAAVSSLLDGNWKISSLKTDYGSLEDRLKREFKYVGILDMNLLQKEEKMRQKFELKFASNGSAAGGAGAAGNAAANSAAAAAASSVSGEDLGIDWVKGREDDEICHEMRILQRELRRVSYLNRAYKHRLYPIVQEQMAWQEYSHILEDLDKQVDQAYQRRTRANTRTKKKKSVPGSAAGSNATPVI